MLTFIVILYFAVASIGLYLFIKLFTKERSKLIVGIIHGLLGLFGISLLIIYTSFLKGDTPVIPILLFVIAFFVGGGMFVRNAQGKNYPLVIALIHVAIALSGIYFLIQFWVG